MKQQLWILNSSLLSLFVLTIIISFLLQQKPPAFRAKKIHIEEREISTAVPTVGLDTIYKYDLFGTFERKEERVSPRSLVTEIPKPKKLTIPPPPAAPKIEFLAPLPITLKGIAFSSDEEKSISMIADETKKEQIYHTGELIKDAQLIKIAQNKVVLLRSNGQHETIFLRKDEIAEEKKSETLDQIVKKIDENNFEIDIRKFPKKIGSLGELTEILSLLTVYEEGKAIGLKVSDLNAKPLSAEIANALGLQQNDLITKINDESTTVQEERMEIYDSISNIKAGETITLALQRENQEKILTYKVTFIDQIKKSEFLPQPADAQATATQTAKEKKKETLFKLSKLQEREKSRRKFAKRHKHRQDTAIKEIRKRLLENMRNRVRNVRIR